MKLHFFSLFKGSPESPCQCGPGLGSNRVRGSDESKFTDLWSGSRKTVKLSFSVSTKTIKSLQASPVHRGALQGVRGASAP